MAKNRWFRVYLNGIERDAIQAPDYVTARRLAKRAYRASCDVIG